MKKFINIICILFITGLKVVALAAEPPATQMTIPGRLLLSEDFDKPIVFAKSTSRQPHPGTWSEGWRVMNGTWTQVNGMLVDDQELSFGKHAFTVKPNTWHTITIEVRGEEMLSTLDGQNPVLGSHPIVGIAKGILSFGTSRSASYRNLQVFEALPNPEWETTRSTYAKSPPATSK